jgi:2-haloalkanoic acid dehalogenase type II
MKPLKAVFFDLDDTLCDDAGAWVISARGAAQIAVNLKVIVNPQPLVDAFLQLSEVYWMSLAPVTETRPLLDIRVSQWRAALEAVTGRIDDDLALALASDYGERRSREIKLFPDAISTLTVLRDYGVKLALITNGVRLTHVDKISYLGLDPLFDEILIADVVGHFKPDPMIFREALRRCDCEPDKAVMVGDHIRNDIGGAQAVGVSAYWFNPNGAQLGPAGPQPHGQIKTLSELLVILEPRLP